MRDPNGPWRHGSVYIYVLNLKSEVPSCFTQHSLTDYENTSL